MTKNEIELWIKSLIKETLDIDTGIEELTGKEKLKNLGVNSVSFIKLIVAIEKQYDIEFEDEDLDFKRIPTINSLINYVSDRI